MSGKTRRMETRNANCAKKRSRVRLKRQRQKSREKKKRRNGSDLMQALSWVERIKFDGEFHGSIKWNPAHLCIQAMIWCWQNSQQVTEAFDVALEQCQALGLSRKVSQSYTSMLNALTRYHTTLFAPLLNSYHQAAQNCSGKHWKLYGWVLMGVDGSRISTARSHSNEKAFCAENYGHGSTAKYRKKKTQGLRRAKNKAKQKKQTPPVPQLFVTLIWHMQLRLPWIWKAGRSSSSERCDTIELVKNHAMPTKTLLCGDAGFVGFEFWKELLEQGLHFLVRVGANVSLLSDEVDIETRQGGLVLCWPKNFRSKVPPLHLRLVPVTVGKTKMWMLTSVLDDTELTTKQIIQIYKMRWLIEVEFRGLKQTLDRVKLKCRNSQRVHVEIQWSILSMGIAELLATQQQIPKSTSTAQEKQYTPKHRSLAKTIKAIRFCLRNITRWATEGKSLYDRLKNSLVQKYKNATDKRARHRHKNPDKKPLGNPKVQEIEQHILKKLNKFTNAQTA